MIEVYKDLRSTPVWVSYPRDETVRDRMGECPEDSFSRLAFRVVIVGPFILARNTSPFRGSSTSINDDQQSGMRGKRKSTISQPYDYLKEPTGDWRIKIIANRSSNSRIILWTETVSNYFLFGLRPQVLSTTVREWKPKAEEQIVQPRGPSKKKEKCPTSFHPKRSGGRAFPFSWYLASGL